MYVASTFLVLVMVIIGVTMMNNYEKIKKVPGSVQEEEEYSPNEEDDVVEAVGDKVSVNEFSANYKKAPLISTLDSENLQSFLLKNKVLNIEKNFFLLSSENIRTFAEYL